MAKIIADRVSAKIEGDFVVFLIGMRVNAWWKVHKWLPVALAMNRMQRELQSVPTEQSGCLETRLVTPGLTVQYWRSFKHLEAFARDTAGHHLPAWQRFNKVSKNARGDVGIWHETFLIPAGRYETLYSGMPLVGLGKASKVVAATGHRNTARGRVFGTNEREGTSDV